MTTPPRCRLAGYPPFSTEVTEYSLKDQITNARYSFPDKYWTGVSGPAKDLIRCLLTLDPERRITIAEALQHPWLCDHELVARADELMDAESATFKVSLSPPPLLPSTVSNWCCLVWLPAVCFISLKGQKRLAEEGDTPQCTSPPLNPAKRSHLDPNSPPSSTPEDCSSDGDATGSNHSTIPAVSSI